MRVVGLGMEMAYLGGEHVADEVVWLGGTPSRLSAASGSADLRTHFPETWLWELHSVG
jgi:hypothetical protein